MPSTSSGSPSSCCGTASRARRRTSRRRRRVGGLVGEVRVSPAELVADWEEEGAERIWVQVVTGRPLAQVLPVVTAVVPEIRERVDDELIGAGEVLVFPDGPVV